MKLSWSVILPGVGATAAVLMGGWDKVIQALIFFVVLDYLTGALLAMKQHRFNSTLGLTGFFKKLGYFVAVMAGQAFDLYIVDKTPVARTLLCMAFVLNEAASTFSNLSALGVPLPEAFTKLLQAEIERKQGKAVSPTSATPSGT